MARASRRDPACVGAATPIGINVTDVVLTRIGHEPLPARRVHTRPYPRIGAAIPIASVPRTPVLAFAAVCSLKTCATPALRSRLVVAQ
jgi:hypothetical protein